MTENQNEDDAPSAESHPASPKARWWKRRHSPATYLAAIFLALVAGYVVYLVVSIGTYAQNGPSAPDRPGWSRSQPAFESLVKAMPTAPAPGAEWVSFEIPARVGEYDMRTTADRVPSGAIFYDTRGTGFLDDAGFAYLPNGPDASLENGSFERPDFKHLSGPWYSWGASW